MILTPVAIIAQASPQPTASAQAEATASPAPDSSIDKAARAWFEAFEDDKILDPSQLTPEMKAGMTQAVVDQVSTGLKPQGAIKTFALQRTAMVQTLRVYLYQVTMEKGAVVTFMYAIDATGKVAGLRFVPAQ